MDGNVETPDAEGGEGQAGRVGLDVVNQLEDGRARREELNACQNTYFLDVALLKF